MKKSKVLIGLIMFVSNLTFGYLIGYSNEISQRQYQFKNIGIDDGLTHGRVQTIVQDKFGYIWFGTRQGINRFDGYTNERFSQFLDNDTLYDIPSVNEMAIDKNNRLWAATSVGLLYFDVNTETFIKYYDEKLDLDYGTPMSLKVAEDNSLWVANSNSLFKLNTSTHQGQEFAITNSNGDLLRNFIECFIQSNGNIWIGLGGDGCGFLDTKTECFTQFLPNPNDPNSFGDKRVECFYEDASGNVWVGNYDKGISIYNPKTGSFSNYLPDELNPTSGRVRAIIKDPLGNTWLGTMAGLYLVDTLNWTFKRYAHSDHLFSTLSHNSVQCIFVDNQMNMWVGTFSGGVSYTSLQRNGFFLYKSSLIPNKYFLSQKDINCFETDNNGLLWIGTESGGLNRFNENTGEYAFYTEDLENPEALQSNNIKAIEVTPENNLWIGTYNGGLSYFDASKNVFTTYKKNSTDIIGLAGDRIYSMLLDRNGNLWVANASIIQMLPKDSTKFISFHDNSEGYNGSKDFRQVNSMMEDSRGWIWFTGHLGVYIYKPEEKTFYDLTDREEFGAHGYYYVIEDEKGNVWFDNDFGQFARYDAKADSYRVYGKSDNIPQVTYSAFTSDNLGNLWATSQDGLYRFNGLVSSPDSVTYYSYGRDNGLQSKFFYPGSIHMSKSNEIFIGGINGFNSFNPEEIKLNPFPPSVVLTNLKINNRYVKINEKVGRRVILKKSLLVSKKLLFNSQIKVFSIEFSGLHFVSPMQNSYKYMIEGFDDDWIITNAEKREATYSNLPAGKYTFKVMATNNDGIWNNKPVELMIKIRPPLYKSKLFIILVILLLGVGIYYGVNARERQLKIDKDRLEASLLEGKTQVEKQQQEILNQQQQIKNRDEQEKEIRWYNSGLAKFSDVLSKNKQNSTILSQAVITNLIEYIEADQGAIFLLNDNDPDNVQLEFAAGYAYSTDNEELKVIYPGEGYVGACFLDKKTIVLDDIPEDYLKIESGLGELAPSNIILIPMKFDELVSGVIEIASFNKIEKYKIEFIEKIAESATSNIAIIKSEHQAKMAVEDAKQNSEELHAADEELRQNLEEMEAIQEELSRKQSALLTEQVMFQTLMNFLEDRITFKDPESIYLRINKVKSDALKLNDADDAIGKSDKHFFGEEHFREAYNKEKEIFNKGIPIINQEELLRFKDGTIKWGATSRVPFKTEDGRGAGTLIITKDISQTKYLACENQANKEILETMAQEYPIILYNLDTYNILSSVSGNGIVILGLKKSQLDGNNIFNLFGISEEQFTKNNENKTIKTEFKVGDKIFTIHHKLIYNEFSEGYNCCGVIV